MKRGWRAVLLATEPMAWLGLGRATVLCSTALAEFPDEGGQGGGKLRHPDFYPGQSSPDLSLSFSVPCFS